VDIQWLGHSCFKIKGSQAVIVTDPFPPDIGYSPGKLSADIITVSHGHPSHSYLQIVGGSPKSVTGPGEYEISGVLIIGVASHHDNEGGTVRGKNTIYLMEVDGLSICHLGDIGHILNDAQVEEIGDIDVLMLPVGGINTIGATRAAEIIRQLEPKIVLPMHYKTPVIDRELEPVDKFLKEMGIEQAEPRPKLTVSKSNLPLSLQVILLNYSV